MADTSAARRGGAVNDARTRSRGLAPDLSLARFERRLGAHDPPVAVRGTYTRRAAVAAVLRFEAGDPEVLLMRRAPRAGDRWSGHVSFPGGREEPADPDLLATAVRETREELGIDLAAGARVLGRLAEVPAGPLGFVRSLSVTPYVFAQTAAAEVTLGDEAAAAFWLPLRAALGGELSGVHRFELGPLTFERPCWRFEDHVVWGLTYHMIEDLLRVVAAS